MKPQTEAALRGLLAMDDEIAPEVLEKAVALLRGDRDSSNLIHVLKFKEVMSLLHIHRRTPL